MTIDKTREEILEVCSEDAYGSWEFWNNNPKTAEGATHVAQTLIDLVVEGKLVPLKYNSRENSYTEVSLDTERLKQEVLTSIDLMSGKPLVFDRDTFYWFEAADAPWRNKNV